MKANMINKINKQLSYKLNTTVKFRLKTLKTMKNYNRCIHNLTLYKNFKAYINNTILLSLNIMSYKKYNILRLFFQKRIVYFKKNSYLNFYVQFSIKQNIANMAFINKLKQN